MPLSVDLRGQKFGRLIALEVIHKKPGKKNRRYYRCFCDCGSVHDVMPHNLVSGDIKSCGCLNMEARSDRWTTHGLSRTEGYFNWRNMMMRCYNPNERGYRRYGGRGIKVCERWHKVENFIADMGTPLPNTTLDRIDVNGDYSPANCRWATYKEQQRNRRSNVRVTLNDKTQCISAWAEELGLKRHQLDRHLKRGGTIEELLLEKN